MFWFTKLTVSCSTTHVISFKIKHQRIQLEKKKKKSKFLYCVTHLYRLLGVLLFKPHSIFCVCVCVALPCASFIGYVFSFVYLLTLKMIILHEISFATPNYYYIIAIVIRYLFTTLVIPIYNTCYIYLIKSSSFFFSVYLKLKANHTIIKGKSYKNVVYNCLNNDSILIFILMEMTNSQHKSHK